MDTNLALLRYFAVASYAGNRARRPPDPPVTVGRLGSVGRPRVTRCDAASEHGRRAERRSDDATGAV